MKQDTTYTTEPITSIILALLDDEPTFEEYRAEKGTNWLIIERIESATGSVLQYLQIKFWYVPQGQRNASTLPSQYQLTIGYHRIGEIVQVALVTLEVLTKEEWIHHPIRNLSFVIETLQEYASS